MIFPNSKEFPNLHAAHLKHNIFKTGCNVRFSTNIGHSLTEDWWQKRREMSHDNLITLLLNFKALKNYKLPSFISKICGLVC